jgi:hypothetical protein
MSKLRPECEVEIGLRAMPYDTAIFLIKESVEKRRGLIYGRLHDREGQHCALGSFWADHPGIPLDTNLVDEVATVNDSVPPTATPKERWKKVQSWLRWKIKVMAGDK